MTTFFLLCGVWSKEHIPDPSPKESGLLLEWGKAWQGQLEGKATRHTS